MLCTKLGHLFLKITNYQYGTMFFLNNSTVNSFISTESMLLKQVACGSVLVVAGYDTNRELIPWDETHTNMYALYESNMPLRNHLVCSPKHRILNHMIK